MIAVNNSMVDAAEEVGALMKRSVSDPTAVLDLAETLTQGGFVAEQAALALYRRIGVPVPADRTQVEYDPTVWKQRAQKWLREIDYNIQERLGREFLAEASELRVYLAARCPTRLRLNLDDLLQEVWVQAWRNSSNLKESNPAELRQWLLAIANRVLATHLRRLARAKNRRRVPVEREWEGGYSDSFRGLSSSSRSPVAEAAMAEATRSVRDALASLPQEQREVLVAIYIEGQSIQSIATTNNRTKQSVYSLLYRSLQHLRKVLE